MDVRTLTYGATGLQLGSYTAFEIAVPMTLQSYVMYVMGETGVELAVARGVPEAGIRAWCESALAGVLDAGPRDVLFDAYVAYVARARSS